MSNTEQPPSLLIATRNENKKREFSKIFDRVFPEHWQIVDVSQFPDLDDVVEDADTFEGNAIKKALETSLLTNMSTMSEDSGLMVDALDGAPGVYSARFAGEHGNTQANNALLVERLRQTRSEDYSARFVATLCLALCPDELGLYILNQLGHTWQTLLSGFPMREGEVRCHENRAIFWLRGELEGQIVETPRGTYGFGYDPHFEVPEFGLTLAQMAPQDKSKISHRARALDKLANVLKGEHP